MAALLARLLSRSDSFKGRGNPYYGISIPSDLRRLWQLIEFTSLLPVLFGKFLLPAFFGNVIIAERYLPDFIVWVSLTTGDSNYSNSLVTKFLKALTNRAKVRIYVTARSDVLRYRKSDESLCPIEDQLALYEKLSSSLDAFRLDTTNRNIEDSLSTVLHLVWRSV